jgi:uncharacterized membrane protein YozB (DUF420 family)
VLPGSPPKRSRSSLSPFEDAPESIVIHLPTLNAILNGTSAASIIVGYWFIRRGRVNAHRACMLTALAASTLFLASYLYYHAQVGSVAFQGRGWIRPVYFAILLSHTILAAAIVPMVLVTVTRAWREQFDRHRRIARWTFPIWLYVSVTGVIIYFLLYHLYPFAVPVTSYAVEILSDGAA